MKFGIFDHMDRGTASFADQYDSRLRLVEAYDAGGFHAYHLAEHHSTPLGIAPSPSVYLSAVAQRTKRLRLGAMVYTLSLHHPLRLLEEICMLDQMSGGRLEVGFGRGASPIEIGYYGVDPDQALSIYQEAYQIIMQGLTGPVVNFTGKHFQLRDVPMEVHCLQKPTPPIWYGLGSPASARWTAENNVNIICSGTPGHARSITDRYRQDWRELGKSDDSLPLLGLSRHVVIGKSRREAQEAASRAYRLWYRSLMHLWIKHGVKGTPLLLSFPNEFHGLQEAGLGIAGTADEVRDWVQDQIERAGANYFVCRFAFGDLTHAESAQSAELFASEVMPAFRNLVMA